MIVNDQTVLILYLIFLIILGETCKNAAVCVCGSRSNRSRRLIEVDRGLRVELSGLDKVPSGPRPIGCVKALSGKQ